MSVKNARGLMQLIPETARRFKVANPFDVRDNLRGGLAYLRWLLAYYQGQVPLVAAAYNAGEAAVDRYRGIPPYPETREYVRRVLRLFRSERHPYDPGVIAPSPIVGAGASRRWSMDSIARRDCTRCARCSQWPRASRLPAASADAVATIERVRNRSLPSGPSSARERRSSSSGGRVSWSATGRSSPRMRTCCPARSIRRRLETLVVVLPGPGRGQGPVPRSEAGSPSIADSDLALLEIGGAAAAGAEAARFRQA